MAVGTRDDKLGTAKAPLVIAAAVSMLTLGLTMAPAGLADGHCDATVSDGESIQAAVDKADPGDTICVEDGTYEESITIPESLDGLTLEATGDATIDGDGVDVGDRPHAAIHVAAVSGSSLLTDVTVEGFTIQNPDGTYGVYAGSGGGGADVSGLVLEGNTIQDVGVDLETSDTGGDVPLAGSVSGVYVRSDYSGITIEDNVIDGVEDPGQGSGRAVGISLSSFTTGAPATDTQVADNEIRNVDATDRAKGLSISGEFDGGTISANAFESIQGNGFAREMEITENPPTPNDAKRIGPKNLVISGHENLGAAATTDGGFDQAIFVGGYEDLGDDHSLTGNSFVASGDDHPQVERFAGPNAGFVQDEADVLDASGNYWDSPLGPTEQGNAFTATGQTGAMVSGFVNYESWCATSECLAPLLQSP
jgi:hypothetical protein